MVFSRMRLTGVGRFQCSCMAYIQGSASCFFKSPSQNEPFKSSVFFLFFIFCQRLLQFTHDSSYLLFVAVCCSKCLLLSSSSCLVLALEENTGRNAAGGREEEGSNCDSEGGVLSSGILLGWSSLSLLHDQCPPLMSTLSDPEFQQHPPPLTSSNCTHSWN